MVEFGVWSTLLLLGSLHGLTVAFLLVRSARNRAANRFLAALLVGVVLMITPYTIGYAGFYDAYPWLTFAPFYWQLAFGPLLYLHVHGLGASAPPRRWALHLLPGLAQGAYYTAAFCLPLQAKWDWNATWHEPVIAPALSVAMFVSLLAYWWPAWRRYRAYQAWLEANSAQREDLHLGWVRGFLLAVAAVATLYAGFGIVGATVADLDYFDYFPFYLVLSLLVYYLGIEGWRHADLRLPAMTPASAEEITPAGDEREAAAPEAPPVPDPAGSATTPAERDWQALGERWAAQVAEAGWWREPELSLSDLSRRLGTNTQYLSRALNDGLGLNFSQFVNRLRVTEAQRRLRAGDDADTATDLLALALEVGFGSKASFNRAFRAHAGVTPSAYRDAHVGDRAPRTQAEGTDPGLNS